MWKILCVLPKSGHFKNIIKNGNLNVSTKGFQNFETIIYQESIITGKNSF